MTSLRRIAYLFLIFASVSSGLYAQRFAIEKGELSFTSNAQLELIKANSDKVQGLIDPSNNQFAFRLNVSSFRGFNSELQRHHFNDNYMESDKFPTASFSGKIIEEVDFSKDSTYEVRAKGNLEIHGQTQIRIVKARLIIKNGKLVVESHFIVPLSDHQISIPKIVSQKIATEIEVVFKASLIRQK